MFLKCAEASESDGSASSIPGEGTFLPYPHVLTCVRNIQGKTLAVGERFVGSHTHTDEFSADSLVNFVKADL